MKTSALIAALICLTSTIPALARDSSHLSCTGFMSAQPDPDNYGLAVQFDESRAEDGESRMEVLSIVWAGDLYQGSRLNKNADFGKNGSVVMASRDGQKRVFYKGKYNIVGDASSGSYKLELKGLLNLEPTRSGHQSFQKLSTTLNCVDLSN